MGKVMGLPADVRKVDPKGRVVLPASFAGKFMKIEVKRGVVVLRMVKITADVAATPEEEKREVLEVVIDSLLAGDSL